ncbi:MAG: hypothetical protein AAB429_03000 [Patescibacteria group bacterium]
MHIRRLSSQSLTRVALGTVFFLLGLWRLIFGHGFHGHPFLAFINEWGLMILGLLMLLGVFTRFSKTLFLLFGALIFGLLIEEDVLTPLYAQRVATVVVMSLIGYFFYKLFRVTFLTRQDTTKRRRQY